jgi:hypothetical protein
MAERRLTAIQRMAVSAVTTLKHLQTTKKRSGPDRARNEFNDSRGDGGKGAVSSCLSIEAESKRA